MKIIEINQQRSEINKTLWEDQHFDIFTPTGSVNENNNIKTRSFTSPKLKMFKNAKHALEI